MQKLLKRLLSDLSDKQRDILTARFGSVFGSDKITLAALGQKYGITRERVRQIETATLRHVAGAIKSDAEAKKIIADAISHLRSLGGVENSKHFYTKFSGPAIFVLKINEAPEERGEDEEFYSFWQIQKQEHSKQERM